MKKIGLYVLAIIAAVTIFANFASAEKISDDTDDVYYWTWNESLGTYKWAHSVTTKPNIDITEISFTTNGQQAILTMKVKGTIESSEKVTYLLYYNTTDVNYWMSYSNGTGFCMANSGTGMAWGNATASGDTITATVNLVPTGTKLAFWGFAAEYTSQFGDKSAEWWGDWAPQDESPWYGQNGEEGGNGGGGGGGGTPGFEGAIFCMSLLAAFVILSRKK